MINKKWKTELLITYKLTDADFKEKSQQEIEKIYNDACTDYEMYSNKRLDKSQINIFGYKYVKSYSETRKRKKQFDEENPEVVEHIKWNLNISRKYYKN